VTSNSTAPLKTNSNRTVVKIFLFLLLSAAGALTFAYFKLEQARPFAEAANSISHRDNIVVVVFDTLRADHLSAYNYKHNTAPFIKQLADKGVVFERAVSVAPSTAPATATFLTSLLPVEHGVTLGKAVTKNLQQSGSSIRMNRLPESVVTLAEYYKNHGYRTFGVTDNINICPDLGFDQGFDEFKCYRNVGAEKINRHVKSWTAQLKDSGEPYFIYIHYMDPHHPYIRHSPWYQSTKDKKERKIRAYDSEINFVDSKFAELAKEFEWEKNSLIAILADHGEELWDHGDIGHGQTLFSEVMHVPLIFHHRNIHPERVPTWVHTIDLLPTLASLTGHEAMKIWRGFNLIDVVKSPHAYSARPLYMQLLRQPEHPRPPKQAVMVNGLQLIAEYQKNGDKKYELYDLNVDFRQFNNIFTTEAARAEPLMIELRKLEAVQPATEFKETEIEVDTETIQQLKTLGYVN